MLRVQVLGIALLAFWLSACSLTRSDFGHPMAQSDTSKPHARVYFIRPQTEHPMGLTDNDLDVSIDGKPLLELTKGEYTLVYLKPRDMTITMSTLMQIRGRWEIDTASQSRRFEFEPGGTYYIEARLMDGEFRGARFIPTLLTRLEAQQAVKHLKREGLAKGDPLL